MQGMTELRKVADAEQFMQSGYLKTNNDGSFPSLEIDCSISTFWQFGAETTFNPVMIFVQAAKMGG